TSPGTVSVTANPAGLAQGTYNGNITITSSGATGSPITIPVTFNVNAGQALTVTPTALNFTYVTGSPAPQPQTFQVTLSGGAGPYSVASQVTGGGSWLAGSPTSGTTPATVTRPRSPQSLAAGNYSGTITVTSPNSSQSQTVQVNLAVQAVPPPNAAAVVNAASYVQGPVSPGEFIILGGTGLGPTDVLV